MRGDQLAPVSVRTWPPQGPVQVHVLDRFKPLRVTEEQFDPSENFDLDDYLHHSFQVMHDELCTVKVRISPRPGAVPWREHESQVLLEEGTRLVYCAKGQRKEMQSRTLFRLDRRWRGQRQL